MRRQFANRRGAGFQEFRRQQLHLVQYDDALGDVVQLAAPARLAGVEGLEELDRRRHDDRCIPILRREARLLGFFRRIEVGMVLQNVFRAKKAPQRVRRLLDDGCIGYDIDNALFAELPRMAKGERHGRQRLAAPRWHG